MSPETTGVGLGLWDALCWCREGSKPCPRPRSGHWMMHSSNNPHGKQCGGGKLCLGCSGSFPSAPCWLLHLHRGESATRELLQDLKDSQCGSFPLCWEGTALCPRDLQQITANGGCWCFREQKKGCTGDMCCSVLLPPHGENLLGKEDQRVSGV